LAGPVAVDEFPDEPEDGVPDLAAGDAGETEEEGTSRIVFGASSNINAFKGVDLSHLWSPATTNFVSALNAQLDGLNKTIASRMAEAFSQRYASQAMARTILRGTASPEIEKLFKQIVAPVRRLPSILDPALFERLLSQIRVTQPSNLQDIRVEEQITLIEMSFKHTFGTFEALPPEVIRSLLDADPKFEGAVDATLIACRKAIVDYCISKAQDLATTGETSVSDHAALLVDAANALSAGYIASSQALSTAILDSSLARKWARNHTTEIKNLLNYSDIGTTRIEGSETMRDIYRKAALIPVVAAFTSDDKGSEYSRHGTIHSASPKQFHPANALKALTITCGTLAFLAKP